MKHLPARSFAISLGAVVVISGLVFGSFTQAIESDPVENSNENTNENSNGNTNENSNSNTNSSVPFSTVSACMKAAITKRDNALVAKFETYAETVVALIQQRKSELNTAWNNSTTSERKAMLKTAWKKYQQQRYAARKTWRDGRKATWTTYKADRKACRTSKYSTDDGQSEGIDTAL